MNKFSKLQKTTITDEYVSRRIALLWNFLIYDLGMRKIVEEYLKPYSDEINFNNDAKYQYPLSLLYNIGKFPSIKKYGEKFWTSKIKVFQVRIGGEWHPVNKLNTNPFDQADVIVDLFRITGDLENVRDICNDQEELKKYLIDFFNNNDVLNLIKINKIKLSLYTKHNRLASEIGEKAESEVADYLIDNGYDILYRGGDGDPIDMAFGCDLIVSKDNRVLTVQVKSKQLAAVKASENENYSSIDLFYWSDNGNIGAVGDQLSLF